MAEIPRTMKAIVVKDGRGPASSLILDDLPIPEPRPGELLVKVAASGVNRPDIFQREGSYPPPPGAPETIGLEIAGEVVSAAGRWQVGDRVCALLGGGGYAEYAAVDARHALPIPAGLDHVAAAALPETVFTVYTNAFEDGRLKAGETFLVHGATSGIGTTAIQMGKAGGARVIATGRGAEKARIARELGADIAIDTTHADFVTVVKEAGGADVVLDMIGAEYFDRNLDLLRRQGRIVFIAGLSGMELTVPVMALMAKNAILTGSTLRPRDADEKARLAVEVERVVWPWVAAGTVRPLVDQTFPLGEAAKAHERLETGNHVGSVILIT